MGRVYSFGYLFHGRSFIIDQSMHKKTKTKQKKEKNDSALFILSFTIGHVYGRARLLHWVHVLERVRMRASFWDSILVYFGWEYDSPIRFCERDERPFFSISGSLLYPSSHLFWMWLLSMLWCELTITHFSISSSSSIFILFLHSTLPHLISFFSHSSWCLTWVQHLHFILAYSICSSLYHHFWCGDP